MQVNKETLIGEIIMKAPEAARSLWEPACTV